ncbi:MAG: hypothetical protein JXE07_05730 [Candidatus Aminicenantes bacterium]|nr:hypothetical protein [Candidatus Aminicenantes bacterium]
MNAIVIVLAPLLFLVLTFVHRLVFLRDIDAALRLVSGLGVAVLAAVFIFDLKRDGIRRHLAAMPERRLARRLFLLSFLIYGLYATGLFFPALPFTGDEPHYLLLTRSLIADGDLNLAEDYKNKEYKAFYNGDLDLHAYPGKKGEGFLYSKHFPGLPVLIVPFYIAGEKAGPAFSAFVRGGGSERIVLVFFCRLPICLLAALLGSVFFLSAWELTRDKRAALLAWLVTSFTMPLFFYSHLIYPELPVALILAALSYGLILKKRLSYRNLLLAGTGIGLLPWFGIKYIPLAGAACLIVGFFASRLGRIKIKAALSFLFPVIVSAGLFLLFLYSLYGRISPQAVYRGSAEGTSLSLSRFLVKDPVDFLSRLLAYFFDQRLGLFVYAPVLILSLAGFFLLRKKISGPAYPLAAMFMAFWMFCSMTFYWAGFCPPGRPLLPVIWIPALFLAQALANERTKTALVMREGLFVLSFFLVLVGLRNPRLLYQDSIAEIFGPGRPELPSQFLSYLSNLLIDWTEWVPRLATTVPEQKTWGVAFLWLSAVLAVTGIFLWKGRTKSYERARLGLKGHLGLVAFFGLAFVIMSFFNVRLENGFAVNGGRIFAQDADSLGLELGGFWVRGESKATLVIRTDRPVSAVSVKLQSPVEGKVTVQLGNKKKEWRHPLRNMPEQTIVFSGPRPFRWQGSCLYTLQVEEAGGFHPYNIDMNSRDKRFLGVFVRLELDDGENRSNSHISP